MLIFGLVVIHMEKAEETKSSIIDYFRCQAMNAALQQKGVGWTDKLETD